MPKFTLKTLLACIALFAIGFAGLTYDLSQSGISLAIVFVAWSAIGEALILPFWRPHWILVAAIAFGIWIGFAMTMIYIFARMLFLD